MSKRVVYRKWTNDGECYFLAIYPNGRMTEISVEKEPGLGYKATIYNSLPSNPMNPSLIKKYKDVCLKFEFDNAKRRVIAMAKGEGIL